MNELYELKEMLMKELETYGKKGELTGGSLEVVDKLTHTLKNLCKIIDDMDGNYSGMTYPYRGGSYARGRGRNARRDAMGRYSSNDGYSRAADDMVQELRELMQDAPDDRTRQEFQRFIQKLEQM